MIKKKESISLLDYPLFTKVDLETLSEEILDLPSDACVAYIIDGDEQVFSELENIVAKTNHTIVSICGLTLGGILSNQPKGKISSIIVHFNRNVLNSVFEGQKPELWDELEKPITQFVVQTAASEMVKYYFDTIIKFFENKEAITESILKIKIKEIILFLLQTENSDYVRNIIKSLFSERKFSFEELVKAHIEHTDSIENLAMATNCSISTFKRRFKEIFHTTPAKYRLKLKLEKVADLLKISDISVSSIGYECGFDSPEHLSRAFKKQYKVSPSEYRLNFSVK
ncbi:AraC family transcriptional regulator [uncultured Tenacibaculum sp.]|uniref:helix-turn-helix domain-containing protein n=1 Tax=uncultured Tenacibaculum sp. TaxID=174713 RepID=UPI00261F82F7|nr:AraC family transcriptional regulator [uncultured Tenacibaculum sp.]